MKLKLLAVLIAATLFLVPNATFGQAPPLGIAAKYVLFTTDGAMTNSGTPHLTHLTGNVGSNLAAAISGFGNVDGQMHDHDTSTIPCVNDVQLAYDQLNTTTPTAAHAVLLGSETLFAGVYHISANATLSSTLILDAQGNPNAVFIFQIQGTLSTDPLSKVILINGGLACNVFWKVEGVVSMGGGSTMRGTIIANNAAINMASLDTLEGRALSINGAVSVGELMAYTPIGCGSPTLTGPAAPALAAVTQFAVFSSSGNVAATPITYVTGDVGSNSTATSGFTPSNVNGTVRPFPDPASAAAAGSLTNVYNYLVALPADIELLDPANFGYGLVLTPHTYHMGTAVMFTGNVYLNAEGNPNAIFVIKVNGIFTTSTISKVILINGAQAKNVFWKIDGAVHVYDNSVFNGTIVVAGAITLNTNDTVMGRVLTIGGAIAVNSSFISNAVTTCVAAPITGNNLVCSGSTTTLSDPDAGGTWVSSNSTVAIVGSSSGIVTGVLPGVSTITYTSPLGCTNTFSITVNATPSVITGPGNVCVGSSITLSDILAGGTWSSSNTSFAIVGTGNGTVTGIAAGIPTITYTVPSGCIATKSVTVGRATSAGTITGPSSVCVGSSIILSDNVIGGTWSSSNSSATVSVLGGVVTGLAAGIDTIRYILASSCGTDTATKAIMINSAPGVGTITGPSSVCQGSTAILSDGVPGGTWTTSNTTVTVSGDTVTGVTPGIDTITYSANNGCGLATTTKTFTVNPTPNAGTITGPSSVCVLSSIILSDGTPLGIWSSSNTTATVVAGVVTGVMAGTDTIRYTVTNISCSATATKAITVNSTGAGVITGPSNVCVGSSIVLSDAVAGGTWSSSNTNATVSGDTVTGVAAGIATISYNVTNACGSSTATKNITINTPPDAGTITGPSSVCVGLSIILSDNVPGGIWSSSNTTATVAGGVVTGLRAGIDTIMYTVTGLGCSATATKTINVSTFQNAGVITGPSNVCVGSTILLSDTTPGGTWSSSNTNATVLAGLVTGIVAGTDTIIYSITNICGTAEATKAITVNPRPDAGTITGPSNVCVGSSIILSDNVIGGTWSSSNTSATVAGGVVTGFAAGIDTIRYILAGGCGIDTATKAITINSSPGAGTITGPSSVCQGSTATLSDGVPGGTWTTSNTTVTVSGDTVTGVTPGIDTITYSANNGCGLATTTRTFTVNPTPNAGTISGPSSVCVGSSIILSDGTPLGIWSSSNTTATVVAGVVTGVMAGTDTIRYTVTNISCSATATKAITVNATGAGVITGPANVCVGSSIVLSDAVAGGTWSSSNTNATVSGDTVTGVAAGLATISYNVTNACGSSTATKNIIISTPPDAGTITGPSSVCVGMPIILSENVLGGIWSSSNTTAAVAGGVVTGLAAGIDTIMYTVTGLGCSATATKTINVNTFPNAGIITGPSNVCVGSTILLSDTTPGGTWSSSNTNATVFGGLVTGMAAGIDTIAYSITNTCGTAEATQTITVNPRPDAGTITSPSVMCAGSSITLTDTAPGGIWSSSNTTATLFGGNILIGIASGIDTVIYFVTNGCGTDSTTKIITINPLPDAGNITGPSSVCTGTTIMLTDNAPGGIWSSSNASATVAGGLIRGITPGIDTISYTVTNSCGTDVATKTVVINSSPAVPVITTQSPATACTGTMYQNFGISTPPQPGVNYNWSAVNATVWAQGTLHEYALVNFTEPGNAYITLTASSGTTCTSESTVMVTVGAAIAQTPTVSYFNNHFVCTPSNEDSYQWGYDDKLSLDSTILTGEINQDYINTNPDANKYYWVMTTSGGCLQKTYYSVPTTVQDINNATSINIYPNPANSTLNVVLITTVSGQVQIDVVNMMGQRVTTIQATDNKASIDVSPLPSGSYLIVCYRDGVKTATARFTKN